MCCNCNEEAPFNYSNGFQTYARPTSGPYIATTHIPSVLGRSTSTELVEFGDFGLKPVAGLYATQNITERSAFGSAFSHTRAGERAEIGRAHESGRREGALIGHFSRTRPNWQADGCSSGLFARAVAY